MSPLFKLGTLTGVLMLCGCTSLPIGPSIMALPGSGKSFDQFRGDDVDCRQYAQYQIGGTDANRAATESGLRTAAAGTLLGALAGAAMGGHQGAGVGAGAGLLMGSMAGAGAGEQSSDGTQQRYDNAYVQCMYGKGEQVPISRGMANRTAPVSSAPGNYLPPPPPNSPPGNYPPPNYPPPK